MKYHLPKPFDQVDIRKKIDRAGDCLIKILFSGNRFVTWNDVDWEATFQEGQFNLNEMNFTNLEHAVAEAVGIRQSYVNAGIEPPGLTLFGYKHRTTWNVQWDASLDQLLEAGYGARK